MGINRTHLKVLLKKDFLTLVRNRGYVIGFVLVPVAFMAIFIAVKSLFDKGETEGPLIFDHFKYTSTAYDPVLNTSPIKFFGNPRAGGYSPLVAHSADEAQTFQSSLLSCAKKNKGRYYYSKIAVISADTELNAQAKAYFEEYVFAFEQTGLAEL